MISLTMSRISSRADGDVELGELRQIDGVDQRVEDRRLDVVVFFGVPALRLGAARRRRDGRLGGRRLAARGTAAAPPEPAAAELRGEAQLHRWYACRTSTIP